MSPAVMYLLEKPMSKDECAQHILINHATLSHIEKKIYENLEGT